MQKAIEVLMNELRLIERVLGSLETFGLEVEKGLPPDRAVIADYGADTKAEMKVKEDRLKELSPHAPPIPVEELLALAPTSSPSRSCPRGSASSWTTREAA